MIELFEGMEVNGEGNINWFPDRQNVLKKLLQDYPPKNIIEIGFNLGHSMKLILDTLTQYCDCMGEYNGVENVIIFDICEGKNNGIGGGHSYVKPNFEILKTHYPNINIQLIEGDSLITVIPTLKNLNLKFDFIEIDGFHEGEYPTKDIQNTIDYLNIGGIIYLDDYNDTYIAIKNAVKNINWDNFNIYTHKDIFYAFKIK